MFWEGQSIWHVTSTLVVTLYLHPLCSNDHTDVEACLTRAARRYARPKTRNKHWFYVTSLLKYWWNSQIPSCKFYLITCQKLSSWCDCCSKQFLKNQLQFKGYHDSNFMKQCNTVTELLSNSALVEINLYKRFIVYWLTHVFNSYAESVLTINYWISFTFFIRAKDAESEHWVFIGKAIWRHAFCGSGNGWQHGWGKYYLVLLHPRIIYQKLILHCYS